MASTQSIAIYYSAPLCKYTAIPSARLSVCLVCPLYIAVTKYQPRHRTAEHLNRNSVYDLSLLHVDAGVVFAREKGFDFPARHGRLKTIDNTEVNFYPPHLHAYPLAFWILVIIRNCVNIIVIIPSLIKEISRHAKVFNGRTENARTDGPTTQKHYALRQISFIYYAMTYNVFGGTLSLTQSTTRAAHMNTHIQRKTHIRNIHNKKHTNMHQTMP